jgi:hypothetical protein
MGKILLIIVSIFCLVSCDYRTEEQRWKDYQAKIEKARQDSIREARFKGFHVIEIDSCEYLIKKETMVGGGHRGFGFGFMSHKGNCKFCEERRKQEKTERENCE